VVVGLVAGVEGAEVLVVLLVSAAAVPMHLPTQRATALAGVLSVVALVALRLLVPLQAVSPLERSSGSFWVLTAQIAVVGVVAGEVVVVVALLVLPVPMALLADQGLAVGSPRAVLLHVPRPAAAASVVHLVGLAAALPPVLRRLPHLLAERNDFRCLLAV
jgi:hypothetical protein